MSETDKAVFNQLADAIEARDRKLAALLEALQAVDTMCSGGSHLEKSVIAIVRAALSASPALVPAEAMPVNEWPNKDLVVKRTKADGTVDYPTIGELHKAIAALKGDGEGL